MGDSARLLPWPTGNIGAAATDPANGTIATNPAFQRQQSRDSSSTMTTATPTDADKLLSVPAPVAAAGPVAALEEAGQNCSRYSSSSRTGSDGGDIVASVECLEPPSSMGPTHGSSNDPRYHTYATLGEFQQLGSASTVTAGGHGQSLTTGDGGGSPGSALTCAYYNDGGQPLQLSLQLNHQTRQNYYYYEVHTEIACLASWLC